MAGLSGNAGASPPSAQDCAPCPRAARVQPRGGKGRSPLHKKTKNLPLPAGKGGGGMGEKPCDMAGKSGDQNRRSPPSGTATARLSGNAGASPPLAHDTPPPAPAPPGFSPGDARGEAPCIRKPKISPFPPGRGSGDGDKKSMMRQAQPATKTAVPSIGDSDGRVIRQRRGKPPLGA